jgi:predicted O-methyltransferase YrrM
MITRDERIELIKKIPSAWSEHIEFAEWLVNKKNPSVIVDLGVDYGFSTFSFALPEIGEIYGIDCFEGDEHAGFRNTFKYVNLKKKQLRYENITFIKDYFDNCAKEWSLPIDILHIDGRHKYEDIENDYQTWSKFLNKNGVILLHDTCCYNTDYGVHEFFDQINISKVNFTNSFGLGIITNDEQLLDDIKKNFYNIMDTKYI